MERKETDKDELIVKCTEIFANNPSELSKLQKFHMEYETEKVFEWYTKDTFIYRQLNKALCTQNIDLLFLYRFFLQDLQNQLTIHQEQSLIRTYRGQLLSKQELKDLSNAIGQYISLNSILSTTIDEQIARTYILGADNNVDVSDELPVLFEIEANPHQPGGIKPFANITARSHFPVEKEVLFMAGSIFKIKEIIYETEFTRIKLTLCSNEENQLKIVFESLRRQYGGEAAGYENEAILNSFGIVIYNMNKLSTAYRFFCRIYHETSDTNPDRIRYCLSIGNAALHLDQYEEAAQWYDRRFKLCDIHGITDAPVLGNLHLTRGNLYTKLKKRERALESYEEALAIFKKNFGENHLLVAICYSSIAIHFERRKYYSHSVELRQKALDIAEKTLPPMHPNLALYHAYLSQLLFDFKHRDLTAVLDHAQKAFDIGSVVFQPNDEQLFNIYCMLCEIHSKLGDFKESMAWLNKIEALEDLQLTDIRTRKITYMCKRCLQVMWIYRYFRWMKNTRFNCFIFHVIPGFYQSLKRNLCNY